MADRHDAACRRRRNLGGLVRLLLLVVVRSAATDARPAVLDRSGPACRPRDGAAARMDASAGARRFTAAPRNVRVESRMGWTVDGDGGSPDLRRNPGKPVHAAGWISSGFHRHSCKPPEQDCGGTARAARLPARSVALHLRDGIECSYPTVDHGRWRIDEMLDSDHYGRWRSDLELVCETGLTHLRCGRSPITRARSQSGTGTSRCLRRSTRCM